MCGRGRAERVRAMNLRPLLLIATTVAALSASAGSAMAGQLVYSTEPSDGDAQIRVMNDDGSNDRLLVHEDDIPGAEAVYKPYVSPDGSTVVFQARTPGPRSGGLYCGFRCSGIYAYRDGQISRISQNPIDCPPGDLCMGLDTHPRVTGSGNNVFYSLLYGEPGGQYGTPQTTSTNYFRSMSANAETEVPQTSCGEGDNVTPNPKVEGQFAVSTYCVGTGGSYSLATMNMNGTGEQILAYDDGSFSNPAFRGDGQVIVGAEQGGDPGIWLYFRDGSTLPTRIASLTWGGDNSPFTTNPTFMGTSKVAFIYDETIRTVPTTCNSCTINQTGSLGHRKEIDAVAWTSQSIPDPVRPAPPTPPADNGGTPPANSTPPATVTKRTATKGQNGGATALATLAAPGKAKLRSVLSRGLKVPFVATKAGKLTMQATIAPRLAKKLRLVRKAGKKPVVVASGAVTVAKAGDATVTLKFTKAAKKRLKRAKSVPLTLQGTFAGSAISGRTRLAR